MTLSLACVTEQADYNELYSHFTATKYGVCYRGLPTMSVSWLQLNNSFVQHFAEQAP